MVTKSFVWATLAVVVGSMAVPTAEAQLLVPVREFLSDVAPRWNLNSMRFIGSRLAIGLVDDPTSGVVRFLEPTSQGWQFGGTSISSPDPECRDFGLSLAVDGTRLAVGSSSGHVFVFETSSATPSLVASWRASPAGYTLIHNFSGQSLLVGLPASNGGQGGGAILRLEGSTISVVQALIPERPAGGLGWSGGVSGDSIVLSAEDFFGNWHAMTWRRQSSGAWAFETELLPTNPSGNPIFGCSSSIDGDVIAVGARDDSTAGFQSGACYVFERLGDTWVQSAKLALSEPPLVNQETGAAVAVHGGRVWISAAGSSENGIGDRGRLLVADKVGGSWQITQTLRSVESGYPTFWGGGATFGPFGAVAVYGFDSPIPFSSWRLRVGVFAAQEDCDQNGVHDLWQVWSGAAADSNDDGIPDPCQVPTCKDADFFPDRNVNGADLGLLLSQWGVPTQYTVADLNRDGVVDGADLGIFLAFWGPCPY